MKTCFHYSFFIFLSYLFCQCDSPNNTENTNFSASTIETKVSKKEDTSPFLVPIHNIASAKYENLQIFILKNQTDADNMTYVPLQKAMDKKWVEIIETSNVNELAITNHSNKTIFIHAGDIVKGGKQDRTLAYDLVVAPNVNQEKITSFCVESDRWHQRGDEAVTGFASNKNMLTSRNLKIASKEANNQTYVWASVSEQQEKLNTTIRAHYSLNVDVKDKTSATSLDLTLENKQLQELKQSYKTHFKTLDLQEATGYACAINGEVYYVDIYNNQQLFSNLWSKLLDALIVEAIADLDTTSTLTTTHLSTETLMQILNKNIDATSQIKTLNSRTEWHSKEDSTKIIFTSLDKGNSAKWVHQNLIFRNAHAMATPISQPQHFYNNQIQSLDMRLNTN